MELSDNRTKDKNWQNFQIFKKLLKLVSNSKEQMLTTDQFRQQYLCTINTRESIAFTLREISRKKAKTSKMAANLKNCSENKNLDPNLFYSKQPRCEHEYFFNHFTALMTK